MTRLQGTLDKLWNDCPEEIQKSYGKAYLEDFKSTVVQQMQRAKPLDKIHEVIDAMIHAVAGEEPQVRTIQTCTIY